MNAPEVSDNTTLESQRAQLRLPDPTPPSPPYTSPATPNARLPGSQINQAVIHTPLPMSNVEPATARDERPMTPPSEETSRKSPGTPSGIKICPKTPERPMQQADSHTPEPASPRVLTPKAPVPQTRSVHLLRNAPGPSTPDATINGRNLAKVNADIDILPLPRSVTSSGSPPRTPERAAKALPTTTQLLATSRRSAPRPRPPSRKNSEVLMDIDGGALVDPSPAKSDRSYFSSPASSSSSDSEGSGVVAYDRSNLPESPTGFGFTQDPDKFRPIGESTVLLKDAAASRLRSLSPNTRLRALSESEGPSQSQHDLKWRSSLGTGMFNSQFDVDGQVDKLSMFLARDVDIEHWDRAPGQKLVEGTDDEGDEEDDVVVEQLTSALTPV